MNQIDTVAALHRELYESGTADRIDLAAFCSRLCTLLRRTLPDTVQFTLTLPSFLVDSRRAASFGVLLNEFVANSAKHAFPDNRPGRIEVIGKRDDEGLLLTLRDNGVGFSGEMVENLGMQVIRAAAMDLGVQEIEFLAADGVRLTLHIPLFAP